MAKVLGFPALLLCPGQDSTEPDRSIPQSPRVTSGQTRATPSNAYDQDSPLGD